MAVKKPAEVLWRAFTGKAPPRTVREMVDAIGGTREAARAAGVTQRTVQKWRLAEDRATPRTVGDMVETLGLTAAARAAKVSERTVRGWQRREERGQVLGPRQLQKVERVRVAAVDQHQARSRPRGNTDRLHDAVLNSAKARQAAINGRRAARIANTQANVTFRAKVIIDTGTRPDERWRDVKANFTGPVLKSSVASWLSGGSAEAVTGQLSEAFGQHYAPGTNWRFGEIRSMRIGDIRQGQGGFFPFLAQEE